MNLPDPNKLVVTSGVSIWLQNETFQPTLFQRIVQKEFEKQPDEDLVGGNDKRFFTFESRQKKFFAAENEIGGLTVMFPDEY